MLASLAGCTTTTAIQTEGVTCVAVSKSEFDYSQIRPLVQDIVGAPAADTAEQRAATPDLAAACAGKNQCVVVADGQCYGVVSQ